MAVDQPQFITDEGQEKKYYHAMLNMYDDDLDPYEYRLIGHYKRVGLTYEGTRKTATKCKMSVGMVAKARQALLEKGLIAIEMLTRKDLKDRGIVNDQNPDDGNKICVVTLVDKMAENVSRYAKGVHEVNTGVRVVNTPVHEVNAGCSPDERKNNTLEEKPTKKKKPASKSDAVVLPFADLIKAWLDTTKSIDPSIYGKKPIRDVAKAMLEAGITPADVSEHTKERSSEPYWEGKAIPFTEVAKTIVKWKEKRTKPAAYGAEPLPTPDYYTPSADELAQIEALKAEALERINGNAKRRTA